MARKQITTELMTGRSFHIIDNVEHTLNSPALAMLLTTSQWRDRLLTTNRGAAIDRNALGVWCVTGNNITLGGDIPRRCYRIRIDARVADPFLRGPERFKHWPLMEWVTQERATILHALLTVCRTSGVAWLGTPACTS